VSDLGDPATTSPDELQDQCKARLLTVANSISCNPVRADSGLSRWRAGTDVSGKREFRGVDGMMAPGVAGNVNDLLRLSGYDAHCGRARLRWWH
jgi:hypothetical protein